MVISKVVEVEGELLAVMSAEELKSLGLAPGDVLEVVPSSNGVLLKKISAPSGANSDDDR